MVCALECRQRVCVVSGKGQTGFVRMFVYNCDKLPSIASLPCIRSRVRRRSCLVTCFIFFVNLGCLCILQACF